VHIGLLLHLYQPSFQTKEVFDKVAADCYIPLVKFLQSHRDITVTLNLPLSLLELLDKYGYSSVIQDLKKLYIDNRIEVVGTAAYHPILPMLPERLASDQILLNEYGLGHYLGSTQDFEGDSALMLRDVRGFFPPELGINSATLDLISSFGYDWCAVGELAIPGHSSPSSNVYKVNDSSCLVISRDRTLSNLVSFKRSLDISDILSYIDGFSCESSFVALDAEFFGHHYKDGFILLDLLLDSLKKRDSTICTVSALVSSVYSSKITSLNESTWSTVSLDVIPRTEYPLWFDSRNSVQVALYDLETHIYENIINDGTLYSPPALGGEDGALKVDKDSLFTLLNANVGSDKYWWISGVTLPAGERLYSKDIVLQAVNYVETLLARLEGHSSYKGVQKRYDTLKKALEDIK
jgi:hypothetical protein